MDFRNYRDLAREQPKFGAGRGLVAWHAALCSRWSTETSATSVSGRVGPLRFVVASVFADRLRRQTSRGIMTSRRQYRNHQANSIIHQHRHLPPPPPAAAAGKTDARGTGRRQTGELLFVDVLFHRFPACRRVTVAAVVESALHNNSVDDDAFFRRFLLSEPRVNHDDALSSRHSLPPTRRSYPGAYGHGVRRPSRPPSVPGARSFSTQSTSPRWHASCRRRG